jgi:NDP-sugar pyrophosphorylase family protein
MDYSVYDALLTGFGKVVLVIRPGMEDDIRRLIVPRYEGRAAVELAPQRLDDLPGDFAPPAERQKPWGTGHAVYAARDCIDEPFAVINADDFYGRASFEALADFLRKADDADPPTYAMVGFQLQHTLSESGSVSRGVCKHRSGHLTEITETHGIEKSGDHGVFTDERGERVTLTGETLVSMNLWGFPPSFLQRLERGLEAFLQERGEDPKAEFQLPDAVQQAMRDAGASVRVLPTEERWCGITHPDDLERMRAHMRRLINQGVYPEQLWS